MDLMNPTARSLVPTLAERLTRVRCDLRMGLPCLISDGHTQAVVVAVEQLTQDRLDGLRDLLGAPELILTDNRARAVLTAHAADTPVRIAPPALADISWFRRLADTHEDGQPNRNGPLHVCSPGDLTLPNLALKLVKSAELLPAVALFNLDKTTRLPAHLGLTKVATGEAMAHFAQTPAFSVVSSAGLPLKAHDNSRLHVFRDPNGTSEHIALEIGTPSRAHPVLCRLHSACFTGDVLGSLKCDCGPQLQTALAQMGEAGAGVLLYLNQEGRGIGLANKMRVYDLQAQGFDTVEANHRLGFEDDERDFRVASVMLRTLGFGAVKLMTNNPAKVKILRDHGTTVTEQLPLRVGKNVHNSGYLAIKALKSGHAL